MQAHYFIGIFKTILLQQNISNLKRICPLDLYTHMIFLLYILCPKSQIDHINYEMILILTHEVSIF
jgi:hypothetical protein